MKIVQFSDLHCSSGSSFLRDRLQTAIGEINDSRPDLVVVTGDITENGFKDEYEEAKRFLDQISASKVIVPGNHDLKYTGHLIFQDFFGSLSSLIIGEDAAFFCANTARPDREEGRFSLDQLNALSEQFSNLRNKVRVVAMHHHPIPIPDTGLERATIDDAGDVLRMFLSTGVDLVLCGHRHRPWLWHLGSTTLVFSGAVSTRKLRGFFDNSYNVIEIHDGQITAKLKIVGGSMLDFREVITAPLATPSVKVTNKQSRKKAWRTKTGLTHNNQPRPRKY